MIHTKITVMQIKNIHILVFLLLINCKGKNINDNKTQEKIFNHFFTELIDKTIIDFRKMPVPPPPPKNNSSAEIKKMEKAFKEAEKNHKIYLDTTIFAPLQIFISDSLSAISENEMVEINNKSQIKYLNIVSNKKHKLINLRDINVSSKYKLDYLSSLKTTFNELKNQDYNTKKHLQKYGGIVSISKIYFNSENDNGIFKLNFSCGKLCGCSYIVFIKNENNKWTIDRIENLGCA